MCFLASSCFRLNEESAIPKRASMVAERVTTRLGEEELVVKAWLLCKEACADKGDACKEKDRKRKIRYRGWL